MPLDLNVIGVEGPAVERSWTSADTILYALGVGAGQPDPTEELAFTTENTAGVDTLVLPTFANMLPMVAGAPQLRFGTFDVSQLLHGEQAFELHRPIPAQGAARTTTTVTGMYDKGSAALVVAESRSVDAATGEPLATSRMSLFIRGEGGFGGEPAPADDWEQPDREPDDTVVYQTRPEQALLYRLSGDRNPLHSDPRFAARGGFPRPILHGMCTYGFTGRALLHSVCGSDPSRFAGMSARFSRPVMPGEQLTVQIWREDGHARFRTLNGQGEVAIDRGRLALSPDTREG
ncbi:MaoC/PaaZ C-terminal domain-containing protein [Microbacterium sp. No. 7]|uniref:MaoC/PaaZ C-terminal domain-containing protein n=1 Tax=Microbacterium sp. No. 7 TaxID=1714373 RepID=UPI0006D0ECEC|nr:MaoC/PaaZ C-terminal domain-containing protein [Microbacterium sp. No. 7]ALJ21193.1 hypothetical protein AOA12_15300 [Microbacterium sp. No. 7]